MPLSASHIKFALDQIDYFKPNDLDKYLEGAIYPDSRYLSGLDRSKTHDYDFWLEKFWHDNDFKKGWASHNISDKAYLNGIREIFPLWVDLNEEWVKIENCAVKIVGDIAVLGSLDIIDKLDIIKTVLNSNNESKEKMKEHLQLIKDCYKNGDRTSIADYFVIMTKSLGQDLGEKIMAKAEFFAADEKLSAAINEFFINGVKKEICKIL
jgi:hypothetical protein